MPGSSTGIMPVEARSNGGGKRGFNAKARSRKADSKIQEKRRGFLNRLTEGTEGASSENRKRGVLNHGWRVTRMGSSRGRLMVECIVRRSAETPLRRRAARRCWTGGVEVFDRDYLIRNSSRACCPSQKSGKSGFVSLKQPLNYWHINVLRVTDPRFGDLGNSPSPRFLQDQGGWFGWFWCGGGGRGCWGEFNRGDTEAQRKRQAAKFKAEKPEGGNGEVLNHVILGIHGKRA